MLSLMRVFRYLCGSKGFSVVEMMIAMVIILMLAITATPMIVFTTQTTNYNKAKATAKNIANERIEEIRAKSFPDIGVIGGNPLGDLQPIETVTVDGRDYTVTTGVNWVDFSGCFAADHAEWDVKMATITVVTDGFYNNGNQEVRETIESLISRDSEQPMYSGANIRVCVFRGWDFESDTDNPIYTPINGVTVTVTDQNTNSSLVSNTVTVSNRSFVLFLELGDSTYMVDVDPSSMNMIVKPGTYPKADIGVALDTTEQLFAYVEYPGSLDIRFYDSDDNPLLISEPGTIELLHPDDGSDERGFSSTIPSGQIVPSDLFSDLWPHPIQQAKAYSFNSFSIPGHLVLLDEDNNYLVVDVAKQESWDGYFEAPGETVELIVYLWKIPEIDEAAYAGDGWLLGTAPSGTINTGLPINERVAKEQEDGNEKYFLKPGIFNRDKDENTIRLTQDSPNFFASEFLFYGSELDISNQAELILHANFIRFENKINLSNNNSTIIIKTLEVDDYDDDYYKIVWPDSDEGTPDMDCYIAKDDIIPTVKGSTLGDVNAPWNNRDYGIVYFESDVYLGNIGEPIISKGAYFFPDGFDFGADYEKAPDNGGLILFAE